MSPTPARRPLSVVIPVYQSSAILPKLIERLEPVLQSASSEFEVILVDDDSPGDGTWHVIEALAERHAWLHGIRMLRNYGQHNALLCGIRAASHPVIVTMDDDLQHPPEEIPRLVAKLEEGFDVVYGTPGRQRHGLWRGVASRITKLVLQGAMGAETASQVSAFRAFRSDLREAFADYASPYVNIDVLLTWGSMRFAAVQVRHDPRASGQSNYTVTKLIVHALNMMTGFSVFPLQLASLVGFGSTLLGVVMLGYVVGRYVIEGASVPGFSFLASIIAIFSGAQLFSLGILGEYLARMHLRSMGRPSYATRAQTGRGSDR